MPITQPGGGGAAAAETDAAALAALTTHEADTTSIHGITDTAALETTTGSAAKVTTHEADTSAVHGFVDTTVIRRNSHANWNPSDQGYKASVGDPLWYTASLTLTGGTVYAFRVPLPESFSCTGIDFSTLTAGATLTYARAAIHGEDRTQLVLSADQTTNWQTANTLVTATVASTALTGGAGRYCYVTMLTTGTTQPTFSRSNSVAAQLMNAGLTATNFRGATGGTGQTAIPTTPTLASNNVIIWCGLKGT